MGSSNVEFGCNRPVLAVSLVAIICMLAIAGAVWWVAIPLRKLLVSSGELVSRVDEASKPVLVCKGNGACLPAQLLAAAGSVAKASGSVAQNMPAIAQSVKTASENSAQASAAAKRTAEESTLLVQDLRKLLNEDLHGAIADLRNSIAKLTDSSEATIRAATAALEELTRLEKQLGEEIAALDPKVHQTIDAMLAILEDPSISKALAHLEETAEGTAKTAHHAGEITESIDIATRGLRKKAALVKTILLKLAGMIKLTFPIW